MRKQLTYLVGMLCIFYNSIAQDYTITGRVTDSKDRTPLAGVTVKIQGTKLATVTQLDGGFSLKSNKERCLKK
jgi:TonB-dependent starch-binding outer membrane protein SusC